MPEFAERFGSQEDAAIFCRRFFPWYNDDHHHCALGYHTPADVHYGRAEVVRAPRIDVLTAAYAAHPERFVRKAPQPPQPGSRRLLGGARPGWLGGRRRGSAARPGR